MQIEVLKGTIGTTGKGGIVEINDKEAENLIALGFAKKAGGKQKKAADEAAKKRNALEEKALELKLGTADEVKVLSDENLKKQVAEKGGTSVKGFLSGLFGGGN